MTSSLLGYLHHEADGAGYGRYSCIGRYVVKESAGRMDRRTELFDITRTRRCICVEYEHWYPALFSFSLRNTAPNIFLGRVMFDGGKNARNEGRRMQNWDLSIR